MSETLIRTGIKNLLEAITGVGKVHDYERFTMRPEEFLLLFKDATSNKIIGWEITRTGADVERVTSNKFKILHHFVIKGYYGLQDSSASEKLFNAVVELIIAKLINNPIADTQGLAIPQVKTINAQVFGDHLCHHAEIEYSVREIITLDEETLEDLVKVNLKYYIQDPATAGDVETGTTTSAATDKLIDSGKDFTTYVTAGMHVENTTDATYSTVVSVDSATQLTLRDDIFTIGEDYRVVEEHAEDLVDNLDA